MQHPLWGGLTAALAIVITAGVWSLLQGGYGARSNGVAADAALPVYNLLPEFRLLERSGRPFGLSDLRGKVWVANLFFSHCADTCPLETVELAKLQAEFAGEPDFRLVSISVDPERDTPQVLTRYADQNGAGSKRWRFLTGHRETIYQLVREGFKLSVEELPAERTSFGGSGETPPDARHGHPDPERRGAERSAGLGKVFRRALRPALAWAHDEEGRGPIHSAQFVLVDRQGRSRGYFSSSDVEDLQQLRQAITRLLREG